MRRAPRAVRRATPLEECGGGYPRYVAILCCRVAPRHSTSTARGSRLTLSEARESVAAFLFDLCGSAFGQGIRPLRWVTQMSAGGNWRFYFDRPTKFAPSFARWSPIVPPSGSKACSDRCWRYGAWLRCAPTPDRAIPEFAARAGLSNESLPRPWVGLALWCGSVRFGCDQIKPRPASLGPLEWAPLSLMLSH
jgi:hypothetical protein